MDYFSFINSPGSKTEQPCFVISYCTVVSPLREIRVRMTIVILYIDTVYLYIGRGAVQSIIFHIFLYSLSLVNITESCKRQNDVTSCRHNCSLV